MFRPPLKEHAQRGSDFEQQVQAYEQGYEHRRLGKAYSNPWKRSVPEYDALGYAKNQLPGWEDELNAWYYNGYYDWNPGDWVPYITDEQQGDYAINPKTHKSRVTLNPAFNGQKRHGTCLWLLPLQQQPQPLISTQ